MRIVELTFAGALAVIGTAAIASQSGQPGQSSPTNNSSNTAESAPLPPPPPAPDEDRTQDNGSANNMQEPPPHVG